MAIHVQSVSDPSTTIPIGGFTCVKTFRQTTQIKCAIFVHINCIRLRIIIEIIDFPFVIKIQ